MSRHWLRLRNCSPQIELNLDPALRCLLKTTSEIRLAVGFGNDAGQIGDRRRINAVRIPDGFYRLAKPFSFIDSQPIGDMP